jgi:glucan phosphoethanolaminetransferase (alkaline phosphatase superfamily)
MNFFQKNIAFTVSFLFLILLIAFESFFLPQSGTETDFLAAPGNYFLSFISLGLTFLFLYFALSAPYQYRLIYFLLFAAAVTTEYGYSSALQHFTTAADFENVIFGTNLDNKIDAAMIYINKLAIVPCVGFLILLLITKPRQKSGWKSLTAILVSSSIFFTLTGALTKNNFLTLASGAYYRTLIGAPWKLDLINFTPRRNVEFRASEKPQNNIVLIIDESISGKHLSLNGYERPTTPFLDDLNAKGFIKNWHLAASGTTCSITSNRLLLTGITDLPDKTRQLLNNPLIYQYAKAMGYKTHFFDGQLNNLWSLTDFDLQFIDERTMKENLQTANDYETDAEIARRVRQIVNRTVGNFIVINKRGTHVPYSNAYPKTAETWSPVYFDQPQPVFDNAELEKQAVINSHDNAVKFNLGIFFETLFGEGLGRETFYIYTSDHGQNLRDDPNEGSHCADAPQMAVVPLFIISDSARLKDVDTGYKPSHSNIFATALDLMNFPENERRYDYNISLLKATAADTKPRYYFVGDLAEGGIGSKILFEENLLVTRK